MQTKILCKNCNKEFKLRGTLSSINGGRRKFCSRACYYEYLPKFDNSGRYQKGERPSKKTEFKKGSVPWSKGIQRFDIKGEKHPLWNGGKSECRGYVLIRVGSQYIFEHRLVIEKFIGRKLKKSEVVHHVDGNKKNNDVKNLKLCESQSEHMRLHKKHAD